MRKLKSHLDAFLGCIIGLVGVFSAVVALKMLETLAAQGRLNLLAWLLLIASGSLFVALFMFTIRRVDPEKREYLELLTRSQWQEEFEVLAASARKMALRWVDFLLTRGMKIEISDAYLPDVTRFLHESGEQILDDPKLLAQAAAYYGEILVQRLDGKWARWKKAGYRDAVARFRIGKKRHEISPGLLTYNVIRNADASLEEFLKLQLDEISSQER